MNQEPEKTFIEQARAAFVKSTARLDGEVLARLRAARVRAVEAVDRHPRHWGMRPWALPSGAVAVLFVAVVGGVVWWNQAPQPAVPFATNNSDDMNIVLASDNLDMYADLDFYSWLESQQQQQGAQAGAENNNSG